MLKTSNFLQVAKLLGVSDNAIRKRLKNRDIDYVQILKNGAS